MLANYLSRLDEAQHIIFAIGSSSRNPDLTNGARIIDGVSNRHQEEETLIWQYLPDELKAKIILMVIHP